MGHMVERQGVFDNDRFLWEEQRKSTIIRVPKNVAEIIIDFSSTLLNDYKCSDYGLILRGNLKFIGGRRGWPLRGHKVTRKALYEGDPGRRPYQAR